MLLMDTRIFAWNCRGAGSKRFLRVYKEYRRQFRPTITIIVEPKISGDTAKKVIQEMGFVESLIVDASGFAGGIWILWDPALITITEEKRTNQLLHVNVKVGMESWFLTAIYGNPALIQRRELWNALRDIAEDMTEPWALVGDFNSILHPSEKLGGAPYDARRAGDFQNCLMDTGLTDIGFVGPAFTRFRNGMQERLDRCLANHAWVTRFPNATNCHLPRVKSDHRPLLLKLNPMFQPAGTKPFKFLAAWLMHEGFKEMAAEAWAKGTDLLSSIEAFHREAKEWNYVVFGHILRRKEKLLGRIERLEKRQRGNDEPAQLQNLREELEEVLVQEEILWCQKARLEWMASGDRNTKYFHAKTLSHRCRNRISALKDAMGNWIDD
ncbi:unnamed protein product [Linum trigynum]|uniref:Endonuclease/exonuclease/phosphatase domain-containing protein n=1 Tax=Linum trigynum TaxID=586398 RepID=A0AAV2CDR8_9ROSI